MAVETRKRSEVTPRERGGLLDFLRGTVDELRKVVWPTPEELYRYTMVVVVTVIVVAAFIAIVDAAVSSFVARFIYSSTTTTG